MSDINIAGAGAWGTALAIHLARQGHAVALWARDPSKIGAENPRLPGIPFPPTIRVVTALPSAEATLIAVPTQQLRACLTTLRPAGPLVLCCKGLEIASGLLPLEVTHDVLPGTQAAILTGPNFAHEIANALPAASVIATQDATLRETLLKLLAGPSFRLYGNDDPVGAQLGGAVKNVIAIAAGAVTGAGLGENARAALITRGLAEMGRLATGLGGRAETLSGLTGLGDLMLSCAGPTSRNFALGQSLGEGASLATLLPPGSPVVEGISTAPAILARAPDLDLPIIRAVAALLAGQQTLPQAITALLSRPARDE